MPSVRAKTLTHEDSCADRCPEREAELPPLWIRTLAGPRIGFGHLRRMTVLARLLSDGFRPVFLADADDPWTAGQARTGGWEVRRFDTGGRWELSDRPAAVLVDTRDERGLAGLLQEAGARGTPVASIHDLGLNLIPSDLVVDGSLWPLPKHEVPSRACYLAGPRYQVLDPLFAEVHARPPRSGRGVRTVCVALGGGDSSRLYGVLPAGFRLWGRPAEVVGLPGFSAWDRGEVSSADWGRARFRWAASDESVPELLYAADMVVAAGGISAFETLCAGSTLLAVAHDELQQRTVSRLAAEGACVDLGTGEAVTAESLASKLDEAAENPLWRESLVSNGRRIVDGRGASRVAQAIRRVVASLHGGAFSAWASR